MPGQVDAAPQRRHRGEQLRRVRLLRQARVQHSHAPVGAGADEAARALGEHERGRGKIDGGERVDAPLLRPRPAGRVQRLVGHGKRDLVDDDEHARGAGGIDAGPERAGADEHRRLVVDEVLHQARSRGRPG